MFYSEWTFLYAQTIGHLQVLFPLFLCCCAIYIANSKSKQFLITAQYTQSLAGSDLQGLYNVYECNLSLCICLHICTCVFIEI